MKNTRSLPTSSAAIKAVLCASAFYLGISQTAFPASWTWDGGSPADGNWSSGTNWIGDVAPVSATDSDIVFSGVVRLNSNADAPFTFRSLVFNASAGAFTLDGELLSVNGAGADANGIENQSSSAISIDNDIRFLAASQVRATGGNLTLGGAINLNGVSAVNFKASTGRTLTVNGVISGNTTTSVGFNSGGIVRMNAANTYTTTANQLFNATVEVGVNTSTTSGAFGAGLSSIQLGTSSGASTSPGILMGGSYMFSRNIQVVTPSGANTTSATLGGSTSDISTISGAIANGSVDAAAQALTLTAAAGGRVNFTGNIIRSSGATGSGDNVTKTGWGIVALEGSSNGYQGQTFVNQGTLLINGSYSTTGGAVSVASGATLGGNGIINRLVTLANGGILSAGDMNTGGVSLGEELTLTAGLELNSTSIMRFDLDSPVSISNDLITVVGGLTLDGLLEINGLAGFGPGSYTLMTYTGAFMDNGLTVSSLPSGFSATVDTSVLGEVRLTVVPEPASLGLILGGLTFGYLVASRRRPQGRR